MQTVTLWGLTKFVFFAGIAIFIITKAILDLADGKIDRRGRANFGPSIDIDGSGGHHGGDAGDGGHGGGDGGGGGH